MTGQSIGSDDDTTGDAVGTFGTEAKSGYDEITIDYDKLGQLIDAANPT